MLHKPARPVPLAALSAQTGQAGLELTRPLPLVPTADDASLDDTAPVLRNFVSVVVEEVSGDLDEEMLDYEPTPKRAEVNVVYLFSDYHVVRDDSDTA